MRAGGITAVALLVAALGAGCGGARSAVRADLVTTNPKASRQRTTTRARTSAPALASPLRLPAVRSRILPGYLLVADRNNDRVLLLSPDKRVVWQANGLHEPDDAFFTPGFRSVITNEEFNDTLAEISLPSGRRIWGYGHAGIAGSATGYLHSPDDAYRLANGDTTVADIANCRIVVLRHDGSVRRLLGGSCAHDPPRSFASPNGDTPLPDGGVLVTEIGGWIDRLDSSGRLVWSVRSPVSYPSDAQLLPNGHILVSGFTTPGKVVEMTRRGAVVWSFGSSSGIDRLDRPSLAIRLPNGLIAINDDWRHRVILVDPHSNRIVWQYGHTDVPGSGRGYLNKPDGMDFLPASAYLRTPSAVGRRAATAVRTGRELTVSRIGTLPQPLSRTAAVALPNGTVVALGGLAGGTSTNAVLTGPPERLRRTGSLPTATHDAAAVLVHGRVLLLGGGSAVSTAAVVQVDPATGRGRALSPLDEPLSDLGAAVVRGRVYLVGGYTGSTFARSILRLDAADRTTVVARLPRGLRYAGVAALGGFVYVAGGMTTQGPTDAVYRVDVRRGVVTRVATLPRPTAHAPLVASQGALWLVGGTASSAVLRIDPTHGLVRQRATLPRPLEDAAAVALPNGTIVVVGGNGSASVLAVSPTR